MSSTTSNGTVEIFGFASATPIGPASLDTTDGGTCSFNQPPTGGTVQVFFGSTGAGSCTINFVISEDGSGFPSGRILANIQANYIPVALLTADVVFVQPLSAGSPTFNVPSGQPFSGILPASGGQSPYTFSLLSQPSAGSISLTNATTGAFTFTPAAGEYGTFTFDYQVLDSTDVTQSATGSVTLVVPAPPVVASNGTLDVPYAGEAEGVLVATGGDGSLTFGEASPPTKGSVSIDPVSGDYTYVANPGQTGSDTFTFRATDGSQPPLTDSGTITVTIAPAPLTTTDLALGVAYEGSASDTIFATGGTPPFTFTVTNEPLKGTVDLDENSGTFTYSAAPGEIGDDTFTVGITDGGTPQQSTSATVTLTIGPEPLVTTDLTLEVDFEGSVDGSVSATGGTLPVTFSVSSDPGKGTVALDDATGDFTYTAGTNQTGTDTFEITLTDSGTPAQVTTATVTVTIGAPDQLMATALTLDVDPGATATGDLTESVTGGFPPYAFQVADLPTKGALSLEPDGTFSYIADDDASGADQFTYTVTDSELPPLAPAATIEGTVLITFSEVEPTATATSTPGSSPTATSTPGSSPTATATVPATTATATATVPTATSTPAAPTETATPTVPTGTPTETVPSATATVATPTETAAATTTVPAIGPVDSSPAPSEIVQPSLNPEEVRQLPSTGHGSSQSLPTLWMLGAAALLVMAFALGLQKARGRRQ